nr:zinc ABC transporter substrate-binding protein [Nitratireductor sp.]
ALESEIAATLEPVKGKGFVVFHDAYQYFEKRFGVTASGSITVSPEVMPGARRLEEVRAKVAELGATCVFSEPQFEPKLVSVVIEGSGARTGVLDAEGGTEAAGPDQYFQLMRNLASSLRDCLGGAS